ncbi:hypothetical protein CBL_08129 [Carabus blaptoides fortunei]
MAKTRVDEGVSAHRVVGLSPSGSHADGRETTLRTGGHFEHVTQGTSFILQSAVRDVNQTEQLTDDRCRGNLESLEDTLGLMGQREKEDVTSRVVPRTADRCHLPNSPVAEQIVKTPEQYSGTLNFPTAATAIGRVHTMAQNQIKMLQKGSNKAGARTTELGRFCRRLAGNSYE